MPNPWDRLERWSWHQSHDQATVLVLVPPETEEVDIYLDENYLIASVRGQRAMIKGRLYGPVNAQSSSWQLERRHDPTSSRGKTSTASTSASSDSSYAVLTDPEISSSFAASLESAMHSDTDTGLDTDEEPGITIIHRIPSSYSSPMGSQDEGSGSGEGLETVQGLPRERFSGRPTHGPSAAGLDPSATSSLASSTNSLSPSKQSPRLLTIYLDKRRPEIWPSLIVAGVPLDMSVNNLDLVGASGFSSHTSLDSVTTVTDEEQKYNMDTTSLVGVGLLVMHEDLDEAFEYFCRAWLQGRNPIAVMKLVSTYLPLHSTPQRSTIVPSEYRYMRYLQRIGQNAGLAQLYKEAGMLHLEGIGNVLASISSFGLSSSPFSLGQSEMGGSKAGADSEVAKRYFRRSRYLDPGIEIPNQPHIDLESSRDLQIPFADDEKEAVRTEVSVEPPPETARAQNRSQRSSGLVQSEDDWSFLYLPGLLGAGLAVGLVGVVSVSWWRRGST